MSAQENIQNKVRVGRKMLLFMVPLWATTVLFAWISVLASTNVIISSNVYLVSALDLILSLLNVCVYAVAFAFLAFAATGGSGLVIPCVIFSVGSALRYFASAIVSGITLGAVSLGDLASALTALLLDVILMGIVLIITLAIKKRGASKDYSDVSAKKKDLAFLPDFSNVLDKSVFVAGVIWAAIKLVSLVAYDVSYVIFIGKLTAGNILWMVIYYLFAILICPVFYLIATWTLRHIKLN